MQHEGTRFSADLGSAGLVVGLNSRVFSGAENAIHNLETDCKAVSDQLAISNCLHYFYFMIAVKRQSRGMSMIFSMSGSSILLCFWNL